MTYDRYTNYLEYSKENLIQAGGHINEVLRVKIVRF